MDDIPFIHEDRPESCGEDGEPFDIFALCACLVQATTLTLSPSTPDGPADSEPSTSPFISSLSLAGAEDNLGKRLLRKLSE